MAHELDKTREGQGAMFTVHKPAWHKLGTVLQQAPSLEEAMRLAGQDFEVELRDLYLDGWAPNGQGRVRVPEHFATVRTDRETVLGVVGSKYTPLQNRDALAVLEPLLDQGLATLETGGTLRGGRDVWMMVQFNIDSPAVQEAFAGEVVPFGLISNNHSGARQVVVQETPIRVVCANTLGMALRVRQRAVGIRHTASVEARTVEAARSLWAGIVERYELAAKQYAQLRQRYLDLATFRRVVLDSVTPLPELGEKPTSRAVTAYHKVEWRRSRVEHLWHHGRGHKGDNSAWEAYNAVAESVDHDRNLWSVRGEKRDAGRRLESMMAGTMADVKDTALRSLLALGQGN